MKTTIIAVGILAAMLLGGGCATGFKDPVASTVKNSDGQPVIQYTRQGSIPAAYVYRPVFNLDTSSVPANARAGQTIAIDPAIIQAIIQAIMGGVTQSANSYWQVMGNTYRYREDILLMGSGIDTNSIKTIMENGSKPKFDAQRPPWPPSAGGQ